MLKPSVLWSLFCCMLLPHLKAMLLLQILVEQVRMHLYIPVSPLYSVPAVSSRYDQGVANTGSSEAAAQLVEQTMGQRLQRQHHQQSTEKETVGGLQKNKRIGVTFVHHLQLGPKQSDPVNWWRHFARQLYNTALTQCYYGRTKHGRT